MVSGNRSITGIFSCLVSCFSTTALVTFITLFATSVLVDTPVHQQALTAAVLDILALAALLVFAIFHACTSRGPSSWSQQRRWTLVPVIMLPFMVAMVLSIYILSWMYRNMTDLQLHGSTTSVGTLVGAAVSMWTISLLSLCVYFATCLRHGSSLPDSLIANSDPLQSYIDEADRKAHSFSMHSLTPSPERPRSTFSDSRGSKSSTSPRSSVRGSVHHFLRPANPKTRITQSREALNTHSDVVSEGRISDGFETWEVTETAEVTASLAQLRGQRLETIPGSRPVSPAYPLDGPFPDEIHPDEISRPNSPHHAQVPRSPSVASSMRAFPPFAPSMSRRPSNQDQSHIHPLFRSDSPVPPPTASPGTILTASPYAGQVLSESDHAYVTRSRKGSALSSRPSSPNPSIARAGSSLSRPTSSRSNTGPASLRGAPSASRPRIMMSPSLGDLRSERERFIRAPPRALHKRERSA